MKKEVGKIYEYFGTIILCTGLGNRENTFAGVVIVAKETSDFNVGDFGSGWTESVFTEYKGKVELDNAYWKPKVEMENCSG